MDWVWKNNKFLICKCCNMPWEKGNKYWIESHKSRKKNDEMIDKFLGILVNGGMICYGDLMDKLASGKELSKAEQEYMDRLEGWREYVRPKLAHTSANVTGEGIGFLLDIKTKNAS